MKSIKNIAQIEDALHRIAELDVGITDADNLAQKAIAAAKKAAEEQTRDMVEERDTLIGLIKAYSDTHREELYTDGKKSRDFTNGTVGYRQGTESIEVSEKTAELLEKAGFAHCIRIKKEPVKSALKGFNDEQLTRFGCRRIPGQESFYVKASEVCIADTVKGAA